MQEVDIKTLTNAGVQLNHDIPNDIIIVGKITELYINYRHDELNLSRLECYQIVYYNQEGDSIKNHILPNSLRKLDCYCSGLTSLPEFTHIENEITLYFQQNKPISCISYNRKLKLDNWYKNNINIEGYEYNPITNQKDLDKYMDYQYHKMNRIKSARK